MAVVRTRDRLISALLERLEGPLYAHGFEPLTTETGFFSDQTDTIHLFSLYVDRVGTQRVITVYAAIQYKPAERMVNKFLQRPAMALDEATIGQAIEVDGTGHWILSTAADLAPLVQEILRAFEVAAAFFAEFSSAQQIAAFLMSKPADPFSAQRILACACLLNDADLFEQCRQRIRAEFEAEVLLPEANPHLKARYAEFNALVQKLRLDSLTGPSSE